MSAWNDLLADVARSRYSSLVAYGVLLTGDRGEAQDLVQDAIVKVFSRVRPLPSVAAADQYVRRAMYTLFLDETRRVRTARAAAPVLAAATSVTGPEAVVAARIDVRAALGRLSPQERACIVLRHFDDLTVPSIAATLGLAEGTVKRYLSDAHAKLGDELAAEGGPRA